MKKKQKKGEKKEWPQNLSNKKLVEEFQDAESQVDNLEAAAFELKKECERRGIDPWE